MAECWDSLSLPLAQQGHASNVIRTGPERHIPLTWALQIAAHLGWFHRLKNHTPRGQVCRENGEMRRRGLLKWALPKANHICFLPEISFGISFDSFENYANNTPLAAVESTHQRIIKYKAFHASTFPVAFTAVKGLLCCPCAIISSTTVAQLDF